MFYQILILMCNKVLTVLYNGNTYLMANQYTILPNSETCYHYIKHIMIIFNF